jgi:3-oxoacyl-[acyl-carrier-protein] synthase-3
MRLGNLFIAGASSWLPPAVSVETAIAEGRYDPAEQAQNSYLSITVAAGDAPPDMAVRAARLAMAQSGLTAADVALTLHASLWYQGIDFWPAASYIHRQVLGGGGRHAPAIDMHQMSNGSLAAVELAASYLTADVSRPAALITVADRLAGPGFDRWRSDLHSIVYGDGAAALVLARQGFARLLSVATISDSSLEPMYRGNQPFGPVWGHAGGPLDNRARRQAFLAQASVDSVVRRTSAGLTEVVDLALSEAGLTRRDISWSVFPNIGLTALRSAYLRVLGLDVAATTWECGRRTGHVGAADQLVSLAWLADRGRAKPGDRVMLVGIGAGFSWTCAIAEFTAIPPARVGADRGGPDRAR